MYRMKDVLDFKSHIDEDQDLDLSDQYYIWYEIVSESYLRYVTCRGEGRWNAMEASLRVVFETFEYQNFEDII